MVENPIDKDKTAEFPGLLEYAHHVGSAVIKPEDKGKIKSRALTAMREQTQLQLKQIQKQVELLLEQATEVKQRVDLSEKLYSAEMSFEPLIHHTYHLYQRNEKFCLMLIGPDEWGNKKNELIFISTVRLLADHTWEIIK